FPTRRSSDLQCGRAPGAPPRLRGRSGRTRGERPRQGLRLRPPGGVGRIHLHRHTDGHRPARLPASAAHRAAPQPRDRRDRRALAALARQRRRHHPHRTAMDPQGARLPEAHFMTTDTATCAIAVIGAGGKMGMRVSNNLAETDHSVSYAEVSPAGQQRVREAGRELTEAAAAVAEADIVVLAVPDLALQGVTAELVPQMKSGAIALTLDPAAAYAGLLTDREDVIRAVAHPCHHSIFLQRTTPRSTPTPSVASPHPRTPWPPSNRTTRPRKRSSMPPSGPSSPP